ncbi:MAG: ABC transporter substrate-binding protein [Nitrospinota bacterium]|jgi:peptide/nickel transport system substrate-binding protein|nr:ABC transporter substrate-binding protein [Nitrospinota bacterium]MDP7369704.1 ABC transporter substrate-binding protein [Nitrospinota bacterium]MDP7663882.1 ABC transporter substrate-binding protein [Nitrospinota bacterium]
MKRKMVLALVLAVSFLWTSATVNAASKGKVVLGMAGALSTFDPHTFSSLPISMHHTNVFETLLTRSPDGKLTTLLAKSYKMASPKVWEFKLREGLKFSNGDPINAEAVKFSFERILDPKLKSKQYRYFKSIKSLKVVDEYTVQIHTKKADPMLPPFLAIYGFIVPPKYYKKHNKKFLARNPVGSGPYVVKKWRKGEDLVYEENPNAWRKPKVKTAIVKFIPESTTRVAALISGDVDIIDNLPPGLAGRVSSSKGARVIKKQSPRTNYILMVIKKGAPWMDVRVRRAMNLAIDRNSITKNIMMGFAKPVAVLDGPASFGHNPNLKPYPYNPEKAKKMLAEAGFGKGFSFDVYIPRGRFMMGKEALEGIAGQWARVGLKANVRVMEWGSMKKIIFSKYKDNVKPFLYYLARMNTAFSTEHMFAGAISSRSAYGGFRDKGIDKLINEARSTMDNAAREKKYQEIGRILRHEKVPIVPLYQTFRIFGVQKKLSWTPRADGKLIAAEVGLAGSN